MTNLDELASLPPAKLANDLVHPESISALMELGDDRFRWLEERVESPIGPNWGRAFRELRPGCETVEAWMRMDKEHCLVAFDALLAFADADSDFYDDEPNPELPDGATSKGVNAAIDRALEAFGNPRLRKDAQRIRRSWPKRARGPRRVSIPARLVDVATILFGADVGTHMADWRKSMALGGAPPKTPFEFWESLLSFAERRGLVVTVDWKASTEDVVAAVDSLTERDLETEWSGEDADVEVVLSELGRSLRTDGVLVLFDRGGDDYPLAIVDPGSIDDLQIAVASFEEEDLRVTRFDGRSR